MINDLESRFGYHFKYSISKNILILFLRRNITLLKDCDSLKERRREAELRAVESEKLRFKFKIEI